MSATIAFAILMIFMLIGDVISLKSRAWIPSMLVVTVILAGCAWSGLLPSNIIEIPGFTASYLNYVVLIFIVDMGSSISIPQMKAQYKTVIIGVSAIVGVAAILFTIGQVLFGWQTVVCAAPPVTGAMVAMIEMSTAAREAGKELLARLPVWIFLTQSIPAFIIIPNLLKRECSRLLKTGVTLDAVPTDEAIVAKGHTLLISKIPEKYKSDVYYLANIAVVAMIASFLAQLFGNVVSPTIFALFLGLILGEFGIIEKDCLKKSRSYGFIMTSSLLASVADVMASTPQEVVDLLGTLVGVLILGIVGILVGSFAAGKVLKISAPMAMAIGMNCSVGFPYNYMLSTEAIRSVAKNDQEKEFLTQKIVPVMLVGGFTTVTIGSVIFAGIMKNFI